MRAGLIRFSFVPFVGSVRSYDGFIIYVVSPTCNYRARRAGSVGAGGTGCIKKQGGWAFCFCPRGGMLFSERRICSLSNSECGVSCFRILDLIVVVLPLHGSCGEASPLECVGVVNIYLLWHSADTWALIFVVWGS